MGLHVDIAPSDPLGMSVCWMLAFRATTAGFAVPAGGMSSIARLLVEDLRAHGGEVRCGARVRRIEVRGGRAVGVELASGERIGAARAVVADVHARNLVFGLLDPVDAPRSMTGPIGRFRPGWGTFKVELALSGPVPWSDPLSPRSAVVHVGDSLEDLQRFADQVRGGDLPDRPYLVVGQQSLVDPSRAPPGQHTLYVYTHAPAELDPARYPGGWAAWRERLADRMEERIEELAPGFRSRVLARAVRDPGDLERINANLVGGDMGQGTSAWDHALFLRPTARWFRHRTPIRGLYLGSSSSHPGPGIHGMCGWNAAEQVLRDVGGLATRG
jgi:phytoene dehydrogenase-like protein